MPMYSTPSPGNNELAFSIANGVEFAFKRNQIIVAPLAFGRLKEILEPGQWGVADHDIHENQLIVLNGVDVLGLVSRLKHEGFVAGPNYALFAQSSPRFLSRLRPNAGYDGVSWSPSGVQANPVYPNPVYPNPVYPNPVYPNPAYPNPVYPNPVYPNPVYSNPVYPNPVYPNPVYPNPVYPNPVYPNPVYPNPVYPNPVCGYPMYPYPVCPPVCAPPAPIAWVCLPPPPRCSCSCQPRRCGTCPPLEGKRHGGGTEMQHVYHQVEENKSSAVPASDPGIPISAAPRSGPTIIVLDSGLAASGLVPPLLADLDDEAVTPLGDRDRPSEDGDPYLDPCAGHGTFVAGVIEQRAPRMNLMVRRVLNTVGATFEWTLTKELEKLLNDSIGIGGAKKNVPIGPDTIINFSLSGSSPDDMASLRTMIEKVQDLGAVIVAAAGNDGSPMPTFPAFFDGVVGVGALDPNGARASFSNYGKWVDACAPGVDIVSCFFDGFNGPAQPGGGADSDKFSGWARWSGTSFAAPAVTAALAREMVAKQCDAQEAVRNLVDAPNLPKVTDLGTKVKM